jgi:hypothetical protein
VKRWIRAVQWALSDMTYNAAGVALGVVVGGLILWGILRVMGA